MSDVITLSSDEEQEVEETPKKRARLITMPMSNLPGVTITKVQPKPSSCIVLSDDDDQDDRSEPQLALKLPSSKTKNPPSSKSEVVIDSDSDTNKPAPTARLNLEKPTSGPPSDTASSHSDLSPLSPPDDIQNAYFVFLDDCVQTAANATHQKLLLAKLPIMKKLYVKVHKLVGDMSDFQEVIENNSARMKRAPEHAVVCFQEVYQWLKCVHRESLQKGQTDAKKRIVRKRLDKSLRDVRRRIRELEEAEVDFDEEENTAYMQMDRYRRRAVELYHRLCRYDDVNPNRGRHLYNRLDFAGSKHSQINIALNKKYRNLSEFPTYRDVDKCIRTCVKENGLRMTDGEVTCEVKRCLEAIGTLIKKKRGRDLYDVHIDFLGDSRDPAKEDPAVEAQLRAHRAVGTKKLDDVFDKYVQLQDKGVDPEVSSESDDSNPEQESDSEHDENVTANV